jgi:hypothetical protein
LIDEIKNKLAYEWKNIYRSLTQADLEQKGTVNVSLFTKIVHQHKVYLSREEIRKLEQVFPGGTGNLSSRISMISS